MWKADQGNGTYKNPILYRDYSDPDAIRVENNYYMIASSFANTPGIPILHSLDLVNWKVLGYALDNIPEERYKKVMHGCGVWAPAIRYHNGEYYICFPMPDEGIYMTKSKNINGPFSTPVNIYKGAGHIDPCPFWDDDGRAYLVYGVAKSRIGYKSVIYIREMAEDGLSLIGDEVMVFDGRENGQDTIEGPKLYKKDGYYYIFAPAGGVKTGWQLVLRSRSIYGPYEYKIVMKQGNTDVNGPHQGAWVDTITGEDWFIHFQDVYSAGRIVHLQPMTWENGWPIIGKPVEGEDYGEPVHIYKKPTVKLAEPSTQNNNEAIIEPDADDDFINGYYNTAWQWNGNHEKCWVLNDDNQKTLGNDGLYLKSVYYTENIPLGDMPNIIMQKWPAPEFCCETYINLSRLSAGDRTGIITMGTTYGALEIEKRETGYSLSFIKGRQIFGSILVETTAEDKSEIVNIEDTAMARIAIRQTVRRTGYIDLNENEKHFPEETVTFSYKILDAEVGDSNTQAKESEYIYAAEYIAKPGRWVGAKNGFYAVTNTEHEPSYLIIEKVRYYDV